MEGTLLDHLPDAENVIARLKGTDAYRDWINPDEPITLYSALQLYDRLNPDLDRAVDLVHGSIKPFSTLPGFDEFAKALAQVPDVEILNAQRMLIQDNFYNPVVEQAISRTKSIEQTLKELSHANQGIGRYLPRRLDRARNETLGHVEQLLGEFPELRTRGVWFPDNFVTGSLIGGGLTFALAYWADGCFFQHVEGQEISRDQFIFRALMAGWVLANGLISGFGATGINRPIYRNKEWHSQERANYLDNKILELFPS